MGNRIKIGVCIVTYNQEQYIAQAIESVLSQETDFSYKIYIGDDFSTDDTLKICSKFRDKFPDKIHLISNKENLGLVKNTINVFKLIQADKVDFIAMLDGDDFWIDNSKLQKQVEFLEKNEDYGLVYTYATSYINNKIKTSFRRKELIDGFISLQKMKVTPISNNTVLFRTPLLKLVDFNDFVERKFKSCDYAMYVVFSNYTKIKGLPFLSAVVRRGHDSVSHGASLKKRIDYIENDIAQFKYLSDRFPHEIPFSEQDEKNHRDYITYNLAVKYCDYELVKDVLKRNVSIKKYKTSILYRSKVLFSSNSFLFMIWCRMSKLRKSIVR